MSSAISSARSPARSSAHRATPACLSARSVFGSESYAPSRIRPWRNENSYSSRKRGWLVRSDDLLHAKPPQRVAHLGDRPAGQLGESTDPEHAAHDGRVLEHRLLVLGKPIQPRGDEPLDRAREVDLRDRPRHLPAGGFGRPEHAVVDQLADDLLDEERVALAALDDRSASGPARSAPGADRRASPLLRPRTAGRGRSRSRSACRRPTSAASRTAPARAVATTMIGPCAQSAT